MPPQESTPQHEDYDLAEKIKSGEYYRAAREQYHILYSDPLSDRYLYLGMTMLSLLIMLVALIDIKLILPLEEKMPFIYNTQDIVEDLPSIQRLGKRTEDTNYLLKTYLASNYVKFRENYNVLTIDRNANAIRTQSTPEVFEEYQQLMDPQNTSSPIALYQRHSNRTVEILDVRPASNADDENEIEVEYDAIVESAMERKKTRMLANIAFRFSDITIDQLKDGTLPPLEFTVTRYQTRRLQES